MALMSLLSIAGIVLKQKYRGLNNRYNMKFDSTQNYTSMLNSSNPFWQPENYTGESFSPNQLTWVILQKPQDALFH